jgi:hypothetical protein
MTLEISAGGATGLGGFVADALSPTRVGQLTNPDILAILERSVQLDHGPMTVRHAAAWRILSMISGLSGGGLPSILSSGGNVVVCR